MLCVPRVVRDLSVHCIPVKVAKCLNTSFLTVLTKQSIVPLNKGSSPGFGRGVV